MKDCSNFLIKRLQRSIVFQAAKIAEETGEAINLVFKLVGFRRESYDVEEIREKLGEELADIVITTLPVQKFVKLTCGRRLKENWILK